MMDIQHKQSLARIGDMGIEACAIRLRAALIFTGLRQMDMANEASISKSVLNNAIAGLTFPSRDVMAYLYRAHRIDFNFILHGDFAQLPGDLQERLFLALEAATSEWDRKERLGRGQEKPKS
jgi:hypothetical protein